jgi:RimJ/RimL family protein N-acetyltransferase
MKIPKNKILKYFFTIVSIVMLIATAMFYAPKIFRSKQAPTYQLSRPDDRRDTIIGNIITLKRFQPKYTSNYTKMCTPIVRKPLYLDFPWTLEGVSKHLQKEATLEQKGLTLWYLIFDNKTKKMIGSIQIREYIPSAPNMPGQFTCWLNEKYWGGGRIREAISLITKEYFRLNDVKQFDAHVEMDNLRSYYALKKAGFKLLKTWEDPAGYQKPRYILVYPNPKYEIK